MSQQQTYPLWKRILLRCSATDMDIISKYPNCIARQLIFGGLLLFSAILILFSTYGIIGLITENVIMKSILTLITVSMIVLIDNLVLSSVSKLTTMIRLPMILLFSTLVFLGLIRYTSENKVYEMLKENSRIESGYYEELESLQGQIENLELSIDNNEVQSDSLEQTYYRELNGFSGARQCHNREVNPETGELIPDPNSCPKAYSSYMAWNSKVDEIGEQKKELTSLEDKIQRLRETEYSVDPDPSEFYSGFIVLARKEPGTVAIVVLLSLLYLFMETAPLLAKLSSNFEPNEYELEKYIQSDIRREKKKISRKSIKKLRREYQSWINKKIKGADFSNDAKMESLNQLFEGLVSITSKWEETLKESVEINKQESTSEENKESEHDETEPEDKVEETESLDSKVKPLEKWNGKTALRTVLILGLMLPLLEVTTISPIQRATGYMAASFPGSFLDDVSIERYNELLKFSGLEAKRQILSSEGDTLYSAGIGGKIPEYFKEFLLASENHRYNSTYCVDPIRVGGAIIGLLSGDPSGGGSTISMQLARTSVLQDQNILLRKIKEVLVGCALMTKLGSERLLEAYIQKIYVGRNIYGFPSASWEYFGKPLDELHMEEAASLVSILNAPNRYINDSSAYRARYERTLNAFVERGLVSKSEFSSLKQTIPSLNRARNWKESVVYRATKQAVELMDSEGIMKGTVNSTISSSLSVSSYKLLNNLTDKFRDETGLNDIDGFVLIAQNQKLLAAVGSSHFTQVNHLNRKSAWKPGSIVKPVLLNEYLAGGGKINDLLPNYPQCFETGENPWCVSNSTPYFSSSNYIDASQALAASANIPFAHLAHQGILAKLNQRLESNDTHLFSNYLANALGAEAVQPIEFFRIIHTFSRPYGTVPKLLNYMHDNQYEDVNLFPAQSSRVVAANLSGSITQPYGTLHKMKSLGWNTSSIEYLAKTGTGEENTSASLFVIRPNGLVLMIGIFSRSGAPMVNEQGNGISGSDLAEAMEAIMQHPKIANETRFRKFSFDMDSQYFIASSNKK